MSYEGYWEHICIEGHHTSAGAHEDLRDSCEVCGASITHFRSVDITNGFEPSNPSSHRGCKEVIGSEDVVTERLLYRAAGTLWREVNE